MNERFFSIRGLALGLILAAGSLAAASTHPTAEPGTGTPPTPAGGERDRARTGASQQPMDGKALRELIERRLEENKASNKRFEEALKKLDAGGDPVAIGKELLDGARENRRAGGGRGQGGDDNGGGRGYMGGGGRGSELGMINGPKLSDADRAKVREMLAEKHPDLLRKVTQLAGTNAETKDKFIDGVGGRVRWLESVREKEPEEFRLRLAELNNGIDVMKLGRDIADAREAGTYDAQAAALRSRLTTLMTTQFDTRQELSKLLLKQLRERAEKQATEIAKKDNERSALIEQRGEEFMRMIDGKSRKGESEAKTETKTPAKP